MLGTYAVTVAAAAFALAAPASTQPSICPLPSLQNGGCIRYTKGFDITGVTTEFDLQYPQVKNECDCIQACLNRPNLCANYVYKFTTPQSVQSGFRTCTLYSNFNLPSNVSVEFDLTSSLNKNIFANKIISHGNNPQNGGLVPQAFKDINLDTVPDPDAVSGPVWHLANGQTQC